jgi:hypothetical protein
MHSAHVRVNESLPEHEASLGDALYAHISIFCWEEKETEELETVRTMPFRDQGVFFVASRHIKRAGAFLTAPAEAVCGNLHQPVGTESLLLPRVNFSI